MTIDEAVAEALRVRDAQTSLYKREALADLINEVLRLREILAEIKHLVDSKDS